MQNCTVISEERLCSLESISRWKTTVHEIMSFIFFVSITML